MTQAQIERYKLAREQVLIILRANGLWRGRDPKSDLVTFVLLKDREPKTYTLAALIRRRVAKLKSEARREKARHA